jgi:hypothetical protein
MSFDPPDLHLLSCLGLAMSHCTWPEQSFVFKEISVHIAVQSRNCEFSNTEQNGARENMSPHPVKSALVATAKQAAQNTHI